MKSEQHQLLTYNKIHIFSYIPQPSPQSTSHSRNEDLKHVIFVLFQLMSPLLLTIYEKVAGPQQNRVSFIPQEVAVYNLQALLDKGINNK